MVGVLAPFMRATGVPNRGDNRANQPVDKG
jgi:hypothetical protein